MTVRTSSLVVKHQSMFASHAVMKLEALRGQAGNAHGGGGRVDFLIVLALEGAEIGKVKNPMGLTQSNFRRCLNSASSVPPQPRPACPPPLNVLR